MAAYGWIMFEGYVNWTSALIMARGLANSYRCQYSMAPLLLLQLVSEKCLRSDYQTR
jgi:hypothetical protein